MGILLSVSLSASAAIFGRKWHLHLIVPLLVIWLYGLLAGMSPSATRACIMGSVYLAALVFGRQRGSLAPIGFAAALMVAVSPSVLYSISFQLSFAAIAGIAAFSDTFGGMFHMLMLGRRWAGLRSVLRAPRDAVISIMGVSIAATITTLPLIAFYFESVSPLGIPASVLTLPALPFLIVSSAGTAFVGLASATLATPFGWLAWGAGAYMSGVVTMLSGLPGVSVEIGNVPAWAVAVYYGALALAYGVLAMFPGQARTLWRRMTGVGMNGEGNTAAAANGNRGAAVQTTGEHGSTMKAAKQDESARRIISGDKGRRAQVRAHRYVAACACRVLSRRWRGRRRFRGTICCAWRSWMWEMAMRFSSRRRAAGRCWLTAARTGWCWRGCWGERMRFNDRHLDMVVATHPHTDHIGGLTLALERYDVGAILERRIDYESAAYEAWARAVSDEQAQGAAVIQARAGQIIALDENTRLEVLWPMDDLLHGSTSDADNASVALRLAHGDVSVLLTGDIFAEAERRAVGKRRGIGQRRAESAASRQRQQQHAGVPERSESCGGCHFGGRGAIGSAIPTARLMERLREFTGQSGTYTTANHGTIELTSDGETLWVRTER